MPGGDSWWHRKKARKQASKSLSASEGLLSTHSPCVCCYCESFMILSSESAKCGCEGQPMGNFLSAELVWVVRLCSSRAQHRARNIGGSCKDLLNRGMKGVAAGHRLSAPYPCPFRLSQGHRQTIPYKLEACSLSPPKGVLWSCSARPWAVGSAGEYLP